MFVQRATCRSGSRTILLAHIVFCISFVAITVRARVQGLDRSLEEAAQDLCADPMPTFFKVTLPIILPGDRRGVPARFRALDRRLRDHELRRRLEQHVPALGVRRHADRGFRRRSTSGDAAVPRRGHHVAGIEPDRLAPQGRAGPSAAAAGKVPSDDPPIEPGRPLRPGLSTMDEPMDQPSVSLRGLVTERVPARRGRRRGRPVASASCSRPVRSEPQRKGGSRTARRARELRELALLPRPRRQPDERARDRSGPRWRPSPRRRASS